MIEKVVFLRSVLHHFSLVKRSEFGDSELVGIISCTRVPNGITEFAEIENRSRDHFPPKTKLYFGNWDLKMAMLVQECATKYTKLKNVNVRFLYLAASVQELLCARTLLKK